MSSHNTNTNADESNSNQAIEHALMGAYEEAGLDPDAPLGDLPAEALVDALGGVLLHRDHAVAAANGDLPATDAERREAYGTGVQADTHPTRPFGDAGDPEAALDIDDDDADALAEYGTGLSGDTSREDRERREEQAEVLADALERLAERRDGGTDDD